MPKPAARERRARTRSDAAVRCWPVDREHLPGYVDILAGAYPLFMTDRAQALAGFQEILSAGAPELIGAFGPGGRLFGGYALYSYVATLAGRGFPAAGLGMVATALDHKKERIALQLVTDFVRRIRERGVPLSFLYPFRHDFYAAMGWGAVGEARQYTVPAGALPLYPERREVRWVRETGWEALDGIHRQSTGGRGALGLSRSPLSWKRMLRQTPLVFVAGPARAPTGYLLARFVKREGDSDNFRYDLRVIEMEWTTPEAMRGLLGFLSSQRDQVLEVVLDWPADGRLETILSEPVRRGFPQLAGHQGQGPTVAHGVMLRLEDPEEAFRVRPYRGSGSIRAEVRTSDPLRAGRPVRFEALLRGADSAGRRARAASARISTDLSSLSRLWAGASSFREAVEFGRVEVDPPDRVDDLDRLFAVAPPWVVERF
jgi:predicted acetyltransferase